MLAASGSYVVGGFFLVLEYFTGIVRLEVLNMIVSEVADFML